MSTDKITLYDLASTAPGTAWSLNPWKTRFLLNFKGLDYKTEWLTYPEIRTTLESHVAPNEVGRPYTSPAVKFPDGTYVMDSRKIANFIEEKYPEPSVHLDSPYLARLEAAVPKTTVGPLVPIIFNRVSKRILTEASLEHWHRVRSEVLGMPLEEAERTKGGEPAFKAADPGFQEVTAMLKENADGPFFMGKTVSYADFVWGGLLIFAQRLGDDIFERVLKGSGDAEPHLKLMEALGPWSKRNDH